MENTNNYNDKNNKIEEEAKRYYVSNLRIIYNIIINLIIFIIFTFIFVKYFFYSNWKNINSFNVIYYLVLIVVPFIFLSRAVYLLKYINNYIEVSKNSFKAKIGKRKYNINDDQIKNIIIKEKSNSSNIKKYYAKIYFEDEEKYSIKLYVKDLFKKDEQESIKKWLEEKSEELFKKNKEDS